MIRTLQLAILSGAAIVLPLSAWAHGSEFLTAKALLLRDGGVQLEVTADYGDNPMIASEEEAKNAVTNALRWQCEGNDAANSLGAPKLEKRTQPDPSSPLPVDPLSKDQAHSLLRAVWQLHPSAPSISFKVPEGSSQSVILWMQHEAQPNEKPRWVMLVSGDESPAISLTHPAPRNPFPWMPGAIACICIISGGVMLRRPRPIARLA